MKLVKTAIGETDGQPLLAPCADAAEQSIKTGVGTLNNLSQNFARVTVEVPALPTTTPAAVFASRVAIIGSAPAAMVAAMVAITVSPAPETS